MAVAVTKVTSASTLPLKTAITFVTLISIGAVNTEQFTPLSALSVLLLKNVLALIILGANDVEFVPNIAV